MPSVKEDPRYGFEVNVMGVVNVLQACRKSAVEHCLFTSTDHVFGDITEDEFPSTGIPVDYPLGFSGPYETSKAAAELAVRCFARTYGKLLPDNYDKLPLDKLPLIALTRCGNVFGPGDINSRRVIPIFINYALGRDRTIKLKYRKNSDAFSMCLRPWRATSRPSCLSTNLCVTMSRRGARR